MNEQIWKLAEQAFDKANNGTISDIKIPKEFIEKFAELIVRECKENFAKVWYEQGLDNTQGAELGKFLTRFEEHFGVEA